MSIIGIMFIAMFVLFFLTVPVAISLGLASTFAVLKMDMQFGFIAQRFFGGVNSFTLLAIPFFILAGTLMESAGISKRIVDFTNTLVGHKTGGLGIVMILSCMIWGAVSGSAAATVAAIGGIMIPTMVEKGYKRNFVAALQASAAGLDVLIPPSIQMVLFCVAVNESITELFMAGFIPGIVLAIVLSAYVWFVSKKEKHFRDRRYSWKERWCAFKDAFWALLFPIIILGGIYSGIFTATEASAIAVFYAIIVGFFIFKTLTFRKLAKTFLDAALTVGAIMLILSTADLFAYVLTTAKVPSQVANFFLGLSNNKYVFLFWINVFLLIVGMFFDPGPGMIILAPILVPAAAAFGINPIHFGMIMVMNFAIGATTPPFAVNLFVSTKVAGIKYEEIIRPIMPFIALETIVLIIINLVPQLSLWLPNLLK